MSEPEEKQPLPTLEQISTWLGQIAKTLTHQAGQLNSFATGVRADMAQLHGAMLAMHAEMARLKSSEKGRGKTHGAAGGLHEPGARDGGTDKHVLPGGIEIGVPKLTAKRWATLWRAVKALWYLGCGAAGGAGWLWHWWHSRPH